MGNENRLDLRHMAQHEHDHVSGAKKVKIVSTDMSIELDAADGDSVISHRLHIKTSIKGQELDAKGLSELTLYVSSGLLDVYVSPADSGNEWYALAQGISTLSSYSINASRVRMDGAGEGHIVGRS